MADCRLPTMPFDLAGKTYLLRCNMNVLADVESMHNGNLMEALSQPGKLRASMEFLAAMLNDYADEKGWEERYTPKTLGRLLQPTPKGIKAIQDTITDLVVKAVTGGAEETEETDEDAGKNGMTTQS